VLWASILLGGIGLLLGLLRSHVLAVVGASVLVAVAYVAVALSLELRLLTSVTSAFGLLSSLQGGYLVGLLVAHCHQWWPRSHLSAGDEQFRSRSNKLRTSHASPHHDVELR
jgi:hypothetical protein